MTAYEARIEARRRGLQVMWSAPAIGGLLGYDGPHGPIGAALVTTRVNLRTHSLTA
jgi:hypothetical protein